MSFAYFNCKAKSRERARMVRRQERLRQERISASTRCVCGNALTRKEGVACDPCFPLIPRALLDELYRHPRGSDPRIAAEAAIENFLRCERAKTNEVGK